MSGWDVVVSDAELASARADAEARMTSRCTIRRKTGATTTVAGLKVPVWADVHTDLPLRLASSSIGDGGVQSLTIGGVSYQAATARCDMPAGTADLSDDDLIDIVSGEWPGTVWRVVKAVMKDQATARRVPIAQVSRPKEWAP